MKKIIILLAVALILPCSAAYAHSADPYWSGESLKANDVSETSVELNWYGARDDERVTKYRIYKDNRIYTTLYSSSNSYTVRNLDSDTYYTFRVEAGDSDGNWSDDGPDLRVRTEDDHEYNYYSKWPSDKEINATDLTATSVRLSWSRASNYYYDDYRYRVYRDGILITTTNDTAAYITGLQPNTTYKFTIEVGDSDSNRTEDGPRIVVKTAPKTETYNLQSNFTDIRGHWAESAIQELHSKGIVDGTSNELFTPDNNITRAEFVSMLVSALNLTIASPEDVFSDVSTHSWYAGAITTAYKNGLVSGASNKFNPNQNVTRQEIASIIAAAIANRNFNSNLNTALKFKDFYKTDIWARSAMRATVGLGLITGIEDNNLNPLGNATRAEAVVIIKRLLDKI